MIRPARRLAAILALAAAALACLPVARAEETAATGVFHGRGIVVAVQPKTGALTLDHEAIPGFMDAMEMMYRVSAPAVSKDLEPGDRIEFAIDAGKYLILSVKRLPPAN